MSSLSPTRLSRVALDKQHGRQGYDGRVNYQQWHALRGDRCRSRALGRSRSVPSKGSSTRLTLKESSKDKEALSLGLDIWLLVLLFCDVQALAFASMACRSFVHESYELAIEAPIGIAELAAWLRSGLSLVREEVQGCAHAVLPTPFKSWVALLLRQELQGRFCSVLCHRRAATIVEDFPSAVRLLNSTDCVEDAVILILPNTSKHFHVSAGEPVTVTKPVSIRGVRLPNFSSGKPLLWLERFRARTDGVVEFSNLEICGTGTDAEAPRGIFDSVLHVLLGECRVVDCMVRVAWDRKAYGVVAGPVPSPFMPPQDKVIRATLLRTRVHRCVAGCMAFMGGQIVVDRGSIIQHCGIAAAACDARSKIFLRSDAYFGCELSVQENSGGVVEIQTT